MPVRQGKRAIGGHDQCCRNDHAQIDEGRAKKLRRDREIERKKSGGETNSRRLDPEQAALAGNVEKTDQQYGRHRRHHRAVPVHDDVGPQRLELEMPVILAAADRAAGQFHDGEQDNRRDREDDQAHRRFAVRHLLLPGPPQFKNAKGQPIDAERKEMRRKQYGNKDRVDGETARP